MEVLRDTTVHVIGKCPIKGCLTRPKRLIVPGVVKADRIREWTEWTLPAPEPYATVRPNAHVNYGCPRPSKFPVHEGAFERAYLAAYTSAGLVCSEHDRWFTLTAVKGVLNIDKTCNSRCVNATGMTCECSCAGHQHGAAYA